MLEENREIIHDNLRIIVTPDEMNASIVVSAPAEGEIFTPASLIELLKGEGIKQGVDKELIAQIVNAQMYGREILIARGKKAVNGTDGYFDILFRTVMPTRPKILEDGSVDYLNMDIYEPVREGQKIAVYHKSTTGTMGYTVTGRLLLPIKGKEKPALRGKNFKIDEDGINYYFKMDGKIEYINGRILISNLFILPMDMTPKTGNIRFDGDVHIKGNVSSGMIIEASGNVVVEGIVESATLKAGRDIVLKQGAIGNYRGMIEAGGNIYGKFLEAISVKCKGSFTCNYIMNCDVYAGGKIDVTGRKGTIVAGKTQSLAGISVYTVGNINEISTILCVGADSDFRAHAADVEKQIIKINSEIEIFESALTKQVQMRDKIVMALSMKSEELRRLMEERESNNQVLSESENAVVYVMAAVYAGVIIKTDDVVYALKEKLDNVHFKKKDKHVAIFKNL